MHRKVLRSSQRVIATLAAAAMLLAAPALAQPVPGFTEDFTSGDGGWTGGSVLTLPGTGGFGGAGDPFLRIATPVLGKLGANSSLSTAYAGDYVAAGVNQVRMWLNDVDTDDALEIHLSIGNGSNLWQFDTGWLPPFHAWGEFIVDLSGPAGWTHIIDVGGETFQQALMSTDRLHIRHDLPPFAQVPNSIKGDFGLDHIQLLHANVGVEPPSWVARPVLLSAPYPNPSRGPVTLAMTQARPGEVRIEIVDVSGRRIRSAVLPAGGAGARTWLWDGLDANGRRVAPGSYRVRATSDEGGTSRALVRVE